MVVVAIIGILAAIAIPQYQTYAARARQSEAKIALASIYTSEHGFFAEQSTYTSCLRQIGGLTKTAASVAITRSYYLNGFIENYATCGPAGGQDCSYYSYSGTTGVSLCQYGTPAGDMQSVANATLNLPIPNTYAIENAMETALASKLIFPGGDG